MKKLEAQKVFPDHAAHDHSSNLSHYRLPETSVLSEEKIRKLQKFVVVVIVCLFLMNI